MGAPDPGDAEIAAVEIAAQIVEHLRASGEYVAKYDTDDQRPVYQRAGRIARATVKPRKMAARTFDGTFVAWWTEPTPLEQEIREHKKLEMVIKIQPSHFKEGTAAADEDPES